MSEIKPYYSYNDVHEPNVDLAPNPTDKFVVEGELTVDWDAMSLDDKSLCAILDEHLGFDLVKSSWGKVRITIERLE